MSLCDISLFLALPADVVATNGGRHSLGLGESDSRVSIRMYANWLLLIFVNELPINHAVIRAWWWVSGINGLYSTEASVAVSGSIWLKLRYVSAHVRPRGWRALPKV